jgi:MFS transporter, DHA1 family, multidrug resistance protein
MGRREFTVLMSMTMALTALSIDIMLPAFPLIRQSFGLDPTSTEVAGIITVFFVGLAVAQLFYGPLADRFGRKPVLYGGYVVFLIGAVLSTLAPTLPLLLAARFLWGVGAAGARVVALSIVRDKFEGEAMAKTMSLIMAIFIMVPVVAPAIGAAIIAIAPWRTLFVFTGVFAGSIALWARRLQETLKPEDRLELSFRRVLDAGKAVVSNRTTVGFTIAASCTTGALLVWLSLAELVVGDVYGRLNDFPIFFGGMAALTGGVMVVNGRLIDRVGLHRLVAIVTKTYVVSAGIFVAIVVAYDGVPPFWLLFVLLSVVFGHYGMIIPNFTSIAMQPMGHIAGTASSVIGATSTFLGVVLSTFITAQFNNTVMPVAMAFFGLGIIALIASAWGERHWKG